MEGRIAVLDTEKHYFWSAGILSVFAFLVLVLGVLDPRFFLFALVALLIIVLFWSNPWILTAMAIALLPLGNIVPIALGKNMILDASLVEILLALTATIVVLQTLFGYHFLAWKKLWLDNVFRILLVYAFISALTFVESVDTKLFFFELRVICFGILAYAMARIVFDNQEKMRWFFAGLSSLVLFLALQVVLLLVENGYSLALFYDRNHLMLPIGAIAFVSALLAVALPTLLGYVLSETVSSVRLYAGCALVLGFVALLILLSKAAIGSFFLGMLYVVWKTRRTFIMPILSVFGGVLLSLLLFSSFLSKLIERSFHAFVDVNSQYRILEYKLAGKILHDHWLMGVGVGQQPIYFQKIYYADFVNFVNNYLLQGWLDLGLAGIILLTILTVVVARRALALVGESRLLPWAPLAVGLTGSLVTAFFNGFAEVTFFGIFYAIVFASLLGIMHNIQSWEKSQ